MTTDWEKVTDLFGAARVLDSETRATFLDLACAGNTDLRAQIDALLGADQDDSFLEPTRPDASAAPWEPIGLATGLVLKDRYRIEDRLGAGGQALVYRAIDLALSRPVVVKVMRVMRPHDVILKAHFEQEMQALSRIDHPSVVGIIDVGATDDSSPFLVIQYVQGVSLRELLQQGPVSSAQAGQIIKSLGAALSAAHAAGVAHQDLKPENVMIQRLADGSEAVKLIDFGIAKIRQSGLSPNVTTVAIAGSIKYMAPEQFEGCNSPAVDVFALGQIACELLCGRPDARALPKTVDRRVRSLIEAAVAFEPNDRPVDVKAWSQVLGERLVAGRGVRRLHRRVARGAIWGASLVCVGLVAFALVLMRNPRGDRIIEKVGAFDPLTEGFQTFNDVTGIIVPNADRTGFSGWRVISRSPGGGSYVHPLTDAQQKRALGQGWKLTAVLHPDEGAAGVDVDFDRFRRFDINVLAEADGDVVRLNTQIVPNWQGQELRLPRVGPAYHKYELHYDPGIQAADLWIDGERRLSGYRGHTQFLEGHGLMFGAAPYKTERGVASFQSVRFEINP